MVSERKRCTEKGTRLLLQVGDKVVPVLGLLETSERHLCSGDVFLRVSFGGAGSGRGERREKGVDSPWGSRGTRTWCPRSTRYPWTRWPASTSSPLPDRCGGQRRRGGWVRPCGLRLYRECGTAHIGSVVVSEQCRYGVWRNLRWRRAEARGVGSLTLKRPAPFLASPVSQCCPFAPWPVVQWRGVRCE